MIVISELIENLIKHAEFNKINMFTDNFEMPQIKLKPSKLIVERRDVFPT